MKTQRYQVDLFNPNRCPARYSTWVTVADAYDIQVRSEAKLDGVYIEKITPVDEEGREIPGKELRKDGLVNVLVFETGTPRINVSMVNHCGDEWSVRVSDGTGSFTTFPSDSWSCAEMSGRFVAELIQRATARKGRRAR